MPDKTNFKKEETLLFQSIKNYEKIADTVEDSFIIQGLDNEIDELYISVADGLATILSSNVDGLPTKEVLKCCNKILEDYDEDCSLALKIKAYILERSL